VAIFIKLRDLTSTRSFPAKPWPPRSKPPSSARDPGEIPKTELEILAQDLPKNSTERRGRNYGVRSRRTDVPETTGVERRKSVLVEEGFGRVGVRLRGRNEGHSIGEEEERGKGSGGAGRVI
jgi:hypothetical protein